MSDGIGDRWARGRVIFSHGLDSGPRANKIVALRPVADAAGWATEAVDDRDVNDDPVARIDRLVARIEGDDRPTVLVGSSMGGFVSVMAAERVKVAGLFVMAPALYLEHRHPGATTRDRDTPKTDRVHVVHGWRDDIIPWQHGYGSPLAALPDVHGSRARGTLTHLNV